jgi:hypothetical protein
LNDAEDHRNPHHRAGPRTPHLDAAAFLDDIGAGVKLRAGLRRIYEPKERPSC